MIEVRQSGIHGQGAFATCDLHEGQRLTIYEGRRYTARQARTRDWDSRLTYVFGLTDGSVIDASDGGNTTRHINHSCSPNCVAFEEHGPRRRLVVVFYALRAIRTGEELFLDYSLQVDDADDQSAFACSCGVDSCRGTMLAIG